MATANRWSRSCEYGKRTVQRNEFGNTLYFSTNEGTQVWTITARSKRHADRIINAMGLDGFNGGVGRAFSNGAWFNQDAKRVEYTIALDI